MGHRHWIFGVGLAASLLLGGLAFADDAPAPAPDKGGYTVLDPTPADQLRGFCTDRPTKSTGACTVDAGHLQYETDLINFTDDRSDGVTTRTWLFTNPTLKLGLTNTLDVEVNMVPVETVTARDRTSGARTSVTGVGDLYARFKLNLMGDDGGNVAIALVPYVKAPTARAGIGNGAVEGGLVTPLVFNLPRDWQLTIDPEADLLANASGAGRHANVSGLLSFSRPLSKTLTASVEVWGDANFDPAGTVRQYSFDLGLAWVPARHPNVQLDGGVNLGLNDVTPGTQVYLGLSQRF
ncbi:MAG: transporter [Caulobacteraceae bacterium]|nr:transporter [Caulobacteraceae bacterium]